MEKKRTVIHWVICVGLVCLIWGGYFVSVRVVNLVREEKKICNLGVAVDYSIVSEVENVTRKDDEYILSGWALRLNSINSEIQLVLQPTNEEEAEVLFARCSDKDEIGEYFKADWEFGKSAYDAEIKVDKLAENVCYEIYVVLSYVEKNSELEEENRKKVATNQYLYNGKLYKYNPDEFKTPDISDGELKEIIDNGSVRLYSAEQGLWVYQYEWKLYFILASRFGSMKENNIGIPVMPYTSCEELLPIGMRGNDHLGFFFENEEYQREGIGEYQIVEVELPTAYPITYISTGLYDATEKKWIENFYIDVVYK